MRPISTFTTSGNDGKTLPDCNYTFANSDLNEIYDELFPISKPANPLQSADELTKAFNVQDQPHRKSRRIVMLNSQSNTEANAPDGKVLAESAGYAGDHSGLKCDEVIKYLRAEACRDTSGNANPQDIVMLLRTTADYLEAAYPHISLFSDDPPTVVEVKCPLCHKKLNGLVLYHFRRKFYGGNKSIYWYEFSPDSIIPHSFLKVPGTSYYEFGDTHSEALKVLRRNGFSIREGLEI